MVGVLILGQIAQRCAMLRLGLVVFRHTLTNLADDVEADAEKQERAEHDAHSHDCHCEAVLVLGGELFNLAVGVLDHVVAAWRDVG